VLPVADIVAIADATGIITAAWWAGKQNHYPWDLEDWLGQPLTTLSADQEIGNPQADIKAHLAQALADGSAQTFEQSLVGAWGSTRLQWQASPFPPTHPQAPGLLLLGRFCHAAALSCEQRQNYGERLNQITRNIRWTLDLNTIWRQTVDGLGELFAIDRCIICTCSEDMTTVDMAAQYQRQGQPVAAPGFTAAERASLPPHVATALSTTTAQVAALTPTCPTSGVVVATRYQDTVNGVLLLYGPPQRQWSEDELSLITDLADQVGTAIAHALLFNESHALAQQLQQANTNLMQKQREFEEARRQAEEASRLKSEFLANTSHELRTPLNGMIGFLKLVLDGMADDPAEQQEFIEEAHKSALHLLTLINDVLDIAKIEAGKMQIDMGPVSLRELLEDVENFTRPQAEQKQLGFYIYMPRTRDEIILHGNYQRLLQVLLNLVSNAIKFTHEGEITITAEIKPQRATYQDKPWPGTVKISVADTGIGVSLEKQDRLFQTFSQVDGERTRQYGGTGLGLAISQRLVEAMGGVVQFISMGEGLGATVTFTTLLYQEPVMVTEDPIPSLP